MKMLKAARAMVAFALVAVMALIAVGILAGGGFYSERPNTDPRSVFTETLLVSFEDVPSAGSPGSEPEALNQLRKLAGVNPEPGVFDQAMRAARALTHSAPQQVEIHSGALFVQHGSSGTIDFARGGSPYHLTVRPFVLKENSDNLRMDISLRTGQTESDKASSASPFCSSMAFSAKSGTVVAAHNSLPGQPLLMLVTRTTTVDASN